MKEDTFLNYLRMIDLFGSFIISVRQVVSGLLADILFHSVLILQLQWNDEFLFFVWVRTIMHMCKYYEYPARVSFSSCGL